MLSLLQDQNQYIFMPDEELISTTDNIDTPALQSSPIVHEDEPVNVTSFSYDIIPLATTRTLIYLMHTRSAIMTISQGASLHFIPK